MDLDTLAQLVDLPIPPEYRPAVQANLERFAAAAKLVMEFELPPEIESAAVFSNDRAGR